MGKNQGSKGIRMDENYSMMINKITTIEETNYYFKSFETASLNQQIKIQYKFVDQQIRCF